jgi:hypothetical protein
MANKDAAFGFRPTRHLTGGQIRAEEIPIAANYNTAIYLNSVVEAVTAGSIEIASVGDVATVGIFGGVFYTDPTTSKPTWSNYYPASTNTSDLKATVYTDPNIVMEAQHNGTGTQAMNFDDVDFAGTSGSTTTGLSSSELATSTVGDGSGNFKQIGISTDPDNSDTGNDNTNAYCVFNTGIHMHKVITAL